MRTGYKTAIAAGFVGAVAMAATAFGQSAGPTPSQSATPRAKVPAEKTAKMHKRFVHSETKVQTADGFATIVSDQGEVTGVSGPSVTIERADGETVVMTATDETKVRRNGEAASVSDIRPGDHAKLFRMMRDGNVVKSGIAAFSPDFRPEREGRRGPKMRRPGRVGPPAEQSPPVEDAAFFA